jgi:hypothetical protein
MNPYQIAQKISQTHKTLSDLLYNNFEETTGNNRLVINDILTELSFLARIIREQADQDFEGESK